MLHRTGLLRTYKRALILTSNSGDALHSRSFTTPNQNPVTQILSDSATSPDLAGFFSRADDQHRDVWAPSLLFLRASRDVNMRNFIKLGE